MVNERVELSCSRCGSKQFKIPADPKPDDVIVCIGCGTKNKYAAIRKAAAKQFDEAAKKAARDLFKEHGFK